LQHVVEQPNGANAPMVAGTSSKKLAWVNRAENDQQQQQQQQQQHIEMATIK